MKVNWSKVGGVLKTLYVAFLKGKTVKVGGTSVTLPSQNHGAFGAGQSPFDSTPSKVEPPRIGGPR